MPRAIFFDAAGTLIRLTKSVGTNYALVAERQGFILDAAQLDRAFAAVWREMPLRPATGQPREDDDKDRSQPGRAPARSRSPRLKRSIAILFEAAYGHFAEAGVWELYPEVPEVLEALASRFELAVVSNFDGRLRVIFEHLSVSKYFRHLFISSELGADKPDPLIYRRALEISVLRRSKCCTRVTIRSATGRQHVLRGSKFFVSIAAKIRCATLGGCCRRASATSKPATIGATITILTLTVSAAGSTPCLVVAGAGHFASRPGSQRGWKRVRRVGGMSDLREKSST